MKLELQCGFMKPFCVCRETDQHVWLPVVVVIPHMETQLCTMVQDFDSLGFNPFFDVKISEPYWNNKWICIQSVRKWNSKS